MLPGNKRFFSSKVFEFDPYSMKWTKGPANPQTNRPDISVMTVPAKEPVAPSATVATLRAVAT